jgi:hypothetical protein
VKTPASLPAALIGVSSRGRCGVKASPTRPPENIVKPGAGPRALVTGELEPATTSARWPRHDGGVDDETLRRAPRNETVYREIIARGQRPAVRHGPALRL